MKTGVIFIHGAGLGSWVWKGVQKSTRLPSLAVDFPNRGGDDVVNNNLSLADYTTHVMKQIETLNVDNVVLVAHSIGGVVALQVAEKLGKRVQSLIFISAAIPAKGDSYLSCLPLSMRVMLGGIMKMSGTRPPKSAIENGLCSGLTDIQTQNVLDRFTPEALKLYTDKSDATIPQVPATYIKLAEDKALAPKIQEVSIHNLKPAKVVTLSSGHLAMLTFPSDIADEINTTVIE